MKKYCSPTMEAVDIIVESLLNAPSKWKVDDGPEIPIVNADGNEDPVEEPTGAKGVVVDDWND